MILNNSSIIQTSDRASTITRSFALNPAYETSRSIANALFHQRLCTRFPYHRVSSICSAGEPSLYVCVCVLNKVEVWSSAIAARGSYVRPESLLGTPRQRLLNYRRSKAAYNTRTHSVSRLPPIPATIIFNPRRNWMRFELLKRLKSNYEYFSPV